MNSSQAAPSGVSGGCGRSWLRLGVAARVFFIIGKCREHQSQHPASTLNLPESNVGTKSGEYRCAKLAFGGFCFLLCRHLLLCHGNQVFGAFFELQDRVASGVAGVELTPSDRTRDRLGKNVLAGDW